MSLADKKRLRVVESEIGDLPAGETPGEQRAMAFVLRAAGRINPRAAGK